jgi:hypothetical protein
MGKRGPRPKNGRDKLRNVRMPDELWEDMKWAVAAREGPGVSETLRSYCSRYITETRRREAEGTLPYQRRSEPDEPEDDEAVEAD